MMVNPKANRGIVLESLQIVRGPYLQQGTESSIMICWATHAHCQGKVWYGKLGEKLYLTQEETKITCNHTVKLDGLKPILHISMQLGQRQKYKQVQLKITFL